MKRYETMVEMNDMLVKAQDELKRRGYDLKEDEWFVVRRYSGNQSIIYKLVVEDGVRKLKLEVSKWLSDIDGCDFILDTKDGVLDAFDDEDAANGIFRDLASKLNKKLGANRWSVE